MSFLLEFIQTQKSVEYMQCTVGWNCTNTSWLIVRIKAIQTTNTIIENREKYLGINLIDIYSN